MKTETLLKRIDYLKEFYEPTKDCVDCGFVCDYEIDDESEMCVCQWAMTNERKEELIALRDAARAKREQMN